MSSSEHILQLNISSVSVLGPVGFENCSFNQKCITEEILWCMSTVSSPSLIKQRYGEKLSGGKNKAKFSIVFAFVVMFIYQEMATLLEGLFRHSSVDKHQFCSFEVFLCPSLFLFFIPISYRLYYCLHKHCFTLCCFSIYLSNQMSLKYFRWRKRICLQFTFVYDCISEYWHLPQSSFS